MELYLTAWFRQLPIPFNIFIECLECHMQLCWSLKLGKVWWQEVRGLFSFLDRFLRSIAWQFIIKEEKNRATTNPIMFQWDCHF